MQFRASPHRHRPDPSEPSPPRRLLRTRAAGALSLAAVLGLSAVPAVAVPTTSTTPAASSAAAAGSFADPSMANRPMYRFWNGGGLMTPESIKQQVAQMKDAGAGGFEANQMTGEVTVDTKMPGFNAAVHGFGTPEWTRAWTQLFQEGKKQGMQVDHLYTPGWSAGIQDISPDGPQASQEIVYGSAFLDAGQTFSGPVPTRALPSGVTKRTLEGVVAYHCTSVCSGTGVPVLDAASATDLTATVESGDVNYTAPAGSGRYVLVAAWSQGTGQTIRLADTPETSYMVDHFGAAGGQAIIDYWEDKVLTPELREALRSSGGSLFFDSLEINRYGQEVRHWTGGFLDEFRERRGYSLRPYIATLSTTDPLSLKSNPAFELGDGVGQRVREDYVQTLSELFVQNHIELLKAWAKKYNMTMRGQAYVDWGSGAINRADAAAALDIAEQEANNRTDSTHPLFMTDASDSWRQVASAKAQTGGTEVSYEAGTFGRADGLARASLVSKLNSQFALGMNKVIYHGWGDQSKGTASTWPGFLGFALGAPETYGAMVPFIQDDRTINDYVGRMQTILRRGTLTNDVAVFWDGAGEASYKSNGLADAGYAYGFINNLLAKDPSATLEDGRLSKLGYRALVLDGTSTSVPMDLATAKRVLTWARTGFPIVVVGDLAERGRGYRVSQDAAYRKVIADLLSENSVKTVSSLNRVTGVLADAGVQPDVSHESTPLVSLHRSTDDSDYYYLFNSAKDKTRATVKLAGQGRPYRYNGWTGAVTPIPEYTTTATGVELDVDLNTGVGELIALTTGNEDTPDDVCDVAVTRTTADDVVADNGTLLLRDTQAGSYQSKLSDGATVTTDISDVGDTIQPVSWKLDVTSWTGGPGGQADTLKTPLPEIAVSVGEDGTLPNWQKIDGLAKISGTSTYTTTVDTGAGWTGGAGAYLDLGQVLGTAQVSVNGTRLDPVDQVDQRRIDLGNALKAGSNTLTVHVATPVYNAGLDAEQEYGLIGPVVVRPYGQKQLDAPCTTKAASGVVATANRSTYGTATIVAAKVTAAGVTGLKGRVTVSEGSKALGAAEVVKGSARIVLSGTTLAAGSHRLTLNYSGDSNAAGSTGTLTVRTAKASTTTSLTAKDRTLSSGQTLRTTVRVTASGIAPTGTVSFAYRGKVVRKNVRLVNGKTTVTFKPRVKGRHTLKVTFKASGNLTVSTDSIRVRVR